MPKRHFVSFIQIAVCYIIEMSAQPCITEVWWLKSVFTVLLSGTVKLSWWQKSKQQAIPFYHSKTKQVGDEGQLHQRHY